MQFLKRWSFRIVMLVVGVWFLLWSLAAIGLVIFQISQSGAFSGSGGIGAVSFGLSEIFFWIAIVPPFFLLVAWLVVRSFLERRPYL